MLTTAEMVRIARRAHCWSYVMLHWGGTRFFLERLVVAATIALMLTVAGVELDRERMVDVVSYAVAEVVTKVRIHI